MMPKDHHDPPYHERQAPLKQLCLMHALNMFVGEPRLNQAHMDQVCDQLVLTSPESLQQQQQGSGALSKLTAMASSNPHKGRWLGGNYDVNVAIYILENEWNYQVKYYQKKNKEDAHQESMDGLLVNVPGLLPWTRHWIIYRKWSSESDTNKDDNRWYRLDSKASGPVPISNIHSEIEQQQQVGNTVLTIQKKQG